MQVLTETKTQQNIVRNEATRSVRAVTDDKKYDLRYHEAQLFLASGEGADVGE